MTDDWQMEKDFVQINFLGRFGKAFIILLW
jgi:hypothetical protein